MTNICEFCHIDDTKRYHRTYWDCERAMKVRICGLEAEVVVLTEKLRNAQETANALNAQWREERARWAALDPARGLDTHGLTGLDDE